MLAVREKRAHVKTASKSYRNNLTNTNALKLKKAQYQLAELTEYIQNQIDKIRDSVEDRQFRRDDILLRHCNAVYNQYPMDRWKKGCTFPFPKKGDIG